LKVITHEALIECDIGRWERLTWDEIRSGDAAALQRFEKDPARFGYPDGENFAQVARRVEKLINTLLRTHEGEAIAIVSHHVVSRVYLAGLLGLPPALAKRVRLDNCGISVVLRENGETRLATLNATMHLWNCRGSGTR
jgi:broad specificity phosphatase PhoE